MGNTDLGGDKRARLLTRQQTAKSKKVDAGDIEQVFAHWKQTINPRSLAVLDARRTVKIGWAVHDYGVDNCKKAIEGITKSPWHMGENPQNKKYCDVELIFRHAENVEKFIALADTRSKKDARREFIEESQ